MRLIDADALERKWQDVLDEEAHKKGTVAYTVFELFIEGLKEEPTIEAKPVVHGEWVRPNKHYLRPVCSECGYYGSAIDMPVNPFNFCPNCGADMREREENG